MPHADPDERPWFCASVPHPMVSLFAFRCPHDGSVVVSWSGGDTDLPHWDGMYILGPFDDDRSTFELISSDLRRRLSSLWRT